MPRCLPRKVGGSSDRVRGHTANRASRAGRRLELGTFVNFLRSGRRFHGFVHVVRASTFDTCRDAFTLRRKLRRNRRDSSYSAACWPIYDHPLCYIYVVVYADGMMRESGPPVAFAHHSQTREEPHIDSLRLFVLVKGQDRRLIVYMQESRPNLYLLAQLFRHEIANGRGLQPQRVSQSSFSRNASHTHKVGIKLNSTYA